MNLKNIEKLFTETIALQTTNSERFKHIQIQKTHMSGTTKKLGQPELKSTLVSASKIINKGRITKAREK